VIRFHHSSTATWWTVVGNTASNSRTLVSPIWLSVPSSNVPLKTNKWRSRRQKGSSMRSKKRCWRKIDWLSLHRQRLQLLLISASRSNKTHFSWNWESWILLKRYHKYYKAVKIRCSWAMIHCSWIFWSLNQIWSNISEDH